MNSGLKFEKPDEHSQAVTARTSTCPVMLALSASKRSNKAIDMALEKARRCKRLVIVYGLNVNIGLYFTETDIGLFPKLKEQCEKELLAESEQQLKAKVEAIAKRAREQGVQVVTYVRKGRFKPLCLEVIEKEKPSLIVTTRPRRPAWFRNLFGSPVDYLISHAGCLVIEV